MMDHRAIRRANLDPLDPFVLCESGWNENELVVDGPGSGKLEILGHFHNRVRFSDTPPFRELERFRRIFRITLARTAIDPRDQRVDV
jgi:hypothetical protein